MTQKELLYVEDAIKHEQNIIEYCNTVISTIDDEKLYKFIENEIKNHESIKQKLINTLGDEIE